MDGLMKIKKYPTQVLNREHPVFKRTKGDLELVKGFSDSDVNRLYKARKIIRGDGRFVLPRDMYRLPYRMTKHEAMRIIQKLTGKVPQEQGFYSRLPGKLTFFGV